MDTTPIQRELRLPVLRLAAWSAGAGWMIAAISSAAAGVATGGGLGDSIKAGFLSGAVTMLGVAAGLVLVIRLGVGSRAGFAVLAGSMARGFVMILAGVAAQIALDPLTLAFWIGLAAGWMAVKVAELAIAIPAFSLKQVERA